MTTTTLQAKIDAARALLEGVDRNDTDAMFDCLVELEMLANDAVADYGVERLLQSRLNARAADVLSTAA